MALHRTVSDANMIFLRSAFHKHDVDGDSLLNQTEFFSFVKSFEGCFEGDQDQSNALLLKVAKRDTINFFQIIQSAAILNLPLPDTNKGSSSGSPVRPKPSNTLATPPPRDSVSPISTSTHKEKKSSSKKSKDKQKEKSLSPKKLEYSESNSSPTQTPVKIAISSPASSSAETDEATQYLASLKVQIAKEEAKLSSLKAQVSSESEKLANLQSEIAAAQATLANNNSSSTTVISPPTPTLVTSGNYKVTETDSDSPLSPHRMENGNDSLEQDSRPRSSTVGGSTLSNSSSKRAKPHTVGTDSPTTRQSKSSKAVITKILVAPKSLAPEDLIAYYTARVDKVIQCQEILRRYTKRKRILMLGSIVKEFQQSELSKGLRQRNAALKEIFSTERTYAESLRKLVDIFIVPIKKQKLLDEEEMEQVFSDIEVITDITSILLEKLEERLKQWPTVQKFGDIFRDSAPLMKLYFRYIRDFSKAQMRLQEFEAKYPELKDFLAKVTTEKTSGLGLMAFLIMPVQRLPRYEMLLRALLNLTEETHVDHRNLSDALESVSNVNKYINQRKKIEELKAQIPTLLSKKTREKLYEGGDDTSSAAKYLKISVDMARNLPCGSKSSSLGSYVAVAFEGENLKTKTKKDTFSPEWKEEFVLGILPTSPPEFTVAVLDRSSKGVLGWLEFKIDDFVKTPDQANWYSLQPPKKKDKKGKKDDDSSAAQSTGEIYLKFAFVKDV